MLWVHGIGFVAVAAAAPFVADEILARDLAIGAIAGFIGLVGMLLLYWSLANGPMAVTAPLSALTAAVLPVLWGLRSDDGALSGTVGFGLLLGLGAVVAISWQSGLREEALSLSPRVLGAAVIAGACFGSLVLMYDATSETTAPWPVVSGRFVTTLFLIGFALVRKTPLSPGSALGFAAVAGLGDTFANVTLLLATSSAVGSSELSVVAVVSAFYPAATILWARFGLDEPLGPVRLAGLALGFAAIALMTLG